MDKKKSILNVSVSLVFKIVTMVMTIVVKRLLIQVCGNAVNGLNSLYLNIIGFLAVAELGVGSAITFCMYKPIVEGNDDQVSALYGLFQRLYLSIGGIILVAGLCLAPFIHLFARDYAMIDVDLYSTFILMLCSVVLSYVFSSKTSLINAHKDNYITTAITSSGLVLQYVLQIITLLLLHSFSAYLICRIVAVLVQWGITELVARKKHAHIIKKRCRLNVDTKKTLTRSIKAMFMHNIGYVLVNAADSVIISIFIGVVALGEYSNYMVIMSSLLGILKLVFSSLTSVVGHLYVQEGNETSRQYCEAFHILNYMLGAVFFMGYYAIADNLIEVLFAPELVGASEVAFVISLNGFVQFMRSTVLTFRDATGTFYNDRWKPLLEGCINVILSILLVSWIGVTGVIAATILTNLLICHVVEPYVLYKNAFHCSTLGYIRRNYLLIGIFMVGMFIMNHCMYEMQNVLMELMINGCISVVISLGCCSLVLLLMRKSRQQMIKLLQGKGTVVNE